ncbi:MAG: TA system VapC family ribonuclease toxin [Verrucomicrobiota bacterium]
MPSTKKTSSASASLFDSNVWVGLTFTAHPSYQTAIATLEEHTIAKPAIFCRATEQSFLRLASTPALLRQYHNAGLTNADIVRILERLLDLNNIAVATEPEPTRALWLKLAGTSAASPKLWMDAYLAAFAIAAHLRFVTFDTDFRQFQPHGLSLQLLQA